MDFAAIYHFLFGTMQGIGCLILIFLVLSTLIAIILERKTRKTFRDRGPREDDHWQFDDKEGEGK